MHILDAAMANLFIRLQPEEFEELLEAATEARRTPNDHAAWLVAQGLVRWRTQKVFESSLPPDALEDIA